MQCKSLPGFDSLDWSWVSDLPAGLPACLLACLPALGDSLAASAAPLGYLRTAYEETFSHAAIASATTAQTLTDGVHANRWEARDR